MLTIFFQIYKVIICFNKIIIIWLTTIKTNNSNKIKIFKINNNCKIRLRIIYK